MNNLSVGIIGLGSFGRFIADICPSGVKVLGFDERLVYRPENVTYASFDEVAQCDIVFLAIPLGTYTAVLSRVKKVLRKETLIVDICSVKTTPGYLLRQFLPDHKNLLVTHPLFGPQSAAKSTKGHKLIVTSSSGERAEQVIRFCEEKLELDVERMSDEQHDRAMATIHALTFFIARSLKEIHIPRETLMTPSYQVLLDLADLDRAHSQELFLTIEKGNPYSKQIYSEFVKEVQKLEKELNSKPNFDAEVTKEKTTNKEARVKSSKLAFLRTKRDSV